MKCCGLKYLYKTMSSRGGPGGVFRMRDLSVARRKECEISSYGCDGTITLDYYDEEFRIFVQAANNTRKPSAVLIVRIGEYRIARRSNYLMRKDDEKKIVVSGFCLCRSVVYDLDGARSRENDRA
jgi:hypothetical protein